MPAKKQSRNVSRDTMITYEEYKAEYAPKGSLEKLFNPGDPKAASARMADKSLEILRASLRK